MSCDTDSNIAEGLISNSRMAIKVQIINYS